MQIKLLRHVILLLVYATPLKGLGQVTPGDSLALVDLYDSTNGVNWRYSSNWKTSAPVSTWSGVTVKDNRVTGLQMWGYNASGVVPASFKNLDGMLSINFIDNGFRGDLLDYISYFKELTYLKVGEQFLPPGFPASLGYLPKLKSMTIYGPRFTGPIPGTFENLSSLTYMDIGYSLHSGYLPAEELSKLNFAPNSLILYGNLYTFNEMEPLVEKFRAKNKENVLVYNDQRNIATSQRNGTLAVSAGGVLANNTYKWYKQGTGLVATIVGDSTYRMITGGTYHASVTNSVATQLTLNSVPVKAATVLVSLCPLAAPVTLVSDANDYYFGFQKSLDMPHYWEESLDGVSFHHIMDNTNFIGTQSASLQLQNVPSSWRGRQYRCTSTLTNNQSTIFTLHFSNIWISTGTANWENASNWSCGTLPDINTDVVINSGNVVVNSDVTVRSLRLAEGVSFTVSPGNKLTIIP